MSQFKSFIAGGAVVLASTGAAQAGQHLTPDNFFDAMNVSQQQEIDGLAVERGGYEGDAAIRITDDTAQNSTMIVDKSNGSKKIFVLNMFPMGNENLLLLAELRADKKGNLSFNKATTGDKTADKAFDINKSSPEAATFAEIAQNAIIVAAKTPAPEMSHDGGALHSTQIVQKGRNTELQGHFMGDKFGPGGQSYELKLKPGNETFEGLTQDMMGQLSKGKTGFDGLSIQGKHELAKDMTDVMLSDVMTASGQRMGQVIQIGGTAIEMTGSALSPATADANLHESLKAVPGSLDPKTTTMNEREAQKEATAKTRAERAAKVKEVQAERKAQHDAWVDEQLDQIQQAHQDGYPGKTQMGVQWRKGDFGNKPK
ncbi:MAG: hypothetical protein EOM37_06425 [Proteobacteria bacterium]|nr:hypothetical protein [Alphaproteobacteria bacterium]NCC03664.1 hypothetical protein [Pseudomonadota bacterium]